MKDKRLPGQSLLDYLWTTYRNYVVSNELLDPLDECIPTLALVSKLLQDLEITKTEVFEVVDSLPVVGDPKKIYILNKDGNYLAYIYVNNLAVLIGNMDSSLYDKIDKINLELDELKNNFNWNEY